MKNQQCSVPVAPSDPIVSTKNHLGVIKTGENVTIVCSATSGNPKPDLFWYRDKNKLPSFASFDVENNVSCFFSSRVSAELVFLSQKSPENWLFMIRIREKWQKLAKTNFAACSELVVLLAQQSVKRLQKNKGKKLYPHFPFTIQPYYPLNQPSHGRGVLNCVSSRELYVSNYRIRPDFPDILQSDYIFLISASHTYLSRFARAFLHFL